LSSREIAVPAPASHSEYTEETAQTADGAEAAFPPFDPTYFVSQLFWLAISFVVLYAVLSRFVLPRIGSIIEERRDRIADDLDTAAQLKAQVDETRRTYEKSLTNARARAYAVASEAKAVADAEIAEAIRQADADMETRLVESEARIRKSRDKALGEVRSIAANAAVMAVEHLVNLEVSEHDAAMAVDSVKG